MEQIIVDVLQRAAEEIKNYNSQAFIITLKGVCLSKYEINYKVAKNLNLNDNYINYSHNDKYCSVYKISHKLVDDSNNIILISEDDEYIKYDEV